MVLFKGGDADGGGAAEFFPFQVRNNNIKLTPLADFFTRDRGWGKRNSIYSEHPTGGNRSGLPGLSLTTAPSARRNCDRRVVGQTAYLDASCRTGEARDGVVDQETGPPHPDHWDHDVQWFQPEHHPEGFIE